MRSVMPQLTAAVMEQPQIRTGAMDVSVVATATGASRMTALFPLCALFVAVSMWSRLCVLVFCPAHSLLFEISYWFI